MKSKILCALYTFLFTLCAYAQEGPYASDEFREVLKQDTYEPNYFTLIFGLILVIFLIYLTGFFYQKLIGVNSKINKKANDELEKITKAKVISHTPLGQGKDIYIVQVKDKTLVLGATQNQVNLLREFNSFEQQKLGGVQNEQNS